MRSLSLEKKNFSWLLAYAQLESGEKLIPLSLIHHPAFFINECHLYVTQCNIHVYGTFLVYSWHGCILAGTSELAKSLSLFMTCSVAASRVLSGAELCKI